MAQKNNGDTDVAVPRFRAQACILRTINQSK